MTPYELHSRVRVGDEYGTIVHVEPAARPFYHVAFDGDKTEGIQNKPIVLHEDIKECWHEGAPFVQIPVDAALFEKFLDAYCASEIMNAAQKDKSKRKPSASIRIQNPVEWNSRLWINVSGAYDCNNDQWDFIDLLPLIPLDTYDGEIRDPSFKHRGYHGYRVVCGQGEFVIADEPVAVCSTTPVRIPDPEPQVKPARAPKRAVTAKKKETTQSIVEQLALME